MRTQFTAEQLADPQVRDSESILRKCVHCGFCTATCPTYVLLGDELDSPRGRIHQIQSMLENGGPPAPETVTHIDRCLSCLSCNTTCPSGVNYMHLVDHARAHIERTHVRPLPDRWLRALLARVLPNPRLFRLSARAAALFRWAAALAPGRLNGLIRLAPDRLPTQGPTARAGAFAPTAPRRMRVVIPGGCVQPTLAPEINAAAVRLLTRMGVEVVTEDAACCGAIPHHLGKTDQGRALAAQRIAAWTREIDGAGLDAIVVTASGCGVNIRDYGHMFREDPRLAADAARVSALALDVTEVIAKLGLTLGQAPEALTVAYQAPCSLQHGQKVVDAPRRLLEAAGFTVVEPREPHLCCGSAGTYSLLQPELSNQLRDRKAGHINERRPDVVASGNIGCMHHLAPALDAPVVHTVELLDWAAGGPRPGAMGRG